MTNSISEQLFQALKNRESYDQIAALEKLRERRPAHTNPETPYSGHPNDARRLGEADYCAND